MKSFGDKYSLKDPWAIYVIQEVGSDICKIGIAQSPEWRAPCIQTGNCRPLILVYEFWTSGRKSAYRIELGAHRSLRESRISGEWFAVTPERGIEAVQKSSASRLVSELSYG